MSTNFTEKFASSIVAVLGCHDRVILKGYLPFGRDQHLNYWVDRCLKIRRKDFLPFLEKQSQVLVDHARAQAAQAGVPYQRLEGRPQIRRRNSFRNSSANARAKWVSSQCSRSWKRAAPSNCCMDRVGHALSSLVVRSGFFTTTSWILHSASCTFACRPGFPSPSRSTSMATTGSPVRCNDAVSASSSTTMPLRNLINRSWPSAWRTAFPSCPG